MMPAEVMGHLRTIGAAAYSRFETVCNSYELAAQAIAEGLPGAFVECGVAAGSQIAAMAYASRVSGSNREIWMYDSFCGIPLAGPKDDCQPGIGAIKHDVTLPERQRLVTSGITSHSLDSVKRNFERWGLPWANVHVVPGWFQDTVSKTAPAQIAVLRLDGDLYESTKVCLDNLYPLVVPQGFVIIDDYALTGCCRAVHEHMGEKFDFQVVPTTQTVIWWRKST